MRGVQRNSSFQPTGAPHWHPAGEYFNLRGEFFLPKMERAGRVNNPIESCPLKIPNAAVNDAMTVRGGLAAYRSLLEDGD